MGFILEQFRPAASIAFATTVHRGNDRGPRAFFGSPSTPSGSFLQSLMIGLLSRRYTTHEAFNDDIIDQYNVFILDQFEVLHNGKNSLEEAVELVEYLHKIKNKKLIILSNTSAPADKALAKLPKIGYDAAALSVP